jgi:hypothetical protein
MKGDATAILQDSVDFLLSGFAELCGYTAFWIAI